MALVKLELKPGIVSNDTGLANEGGFSAGNRCRSFQGKVQPVGGWSLRTLVKIDGRARGSHAWSTNAGAKCFAAGTSKGLWAEYDGNLRDITGPLHERVLKDAFTTQNGSSIVTISLPFHGLREGQDVTFSHHQSPVAGLTIEGVYTVASVPTRGMFTIEAGTSANADVSLGGGYVDFIAHLPPGLESNPMRGYGSGEYGEGLYGTSDNTAGVRVWTLDNWGEYLLANVSGYGIWEWQPLSNYNDLAYNGDFANADGWGLGTGWTIAASKASKAAGTGSSLSQSVEDLVDGGLTVRVNFTVTRSAGTVKFRVNAGATPAVIDVGEASSPITKSGTYTRLFRVPALAKDFVWEADGAFAGSISNVSYHIESKAYRITTAPPVVDAMYVNTNGLVVALGTTSVDEGAYDPTLVRCSDLGNNRAWVPDDGSYASFFNIRGIGGRLMQGVATRQQDLVGGDSGIASLQFTGELGDAFTVNILGTGCGLVSRHAMIEQNGFVFWGSAENFYIFRGVGATSLGIPEILPCPISKDFFGNIDRNQLAKCHVGVVPGFSEVWFFYPDKRDGDECSRAVAYSWTEGHWHTHVIDRTTWCSSGIFSAPIAVASSGRLFDHETGTTANGNNLGSWIETSDLDIADGETLLAILGMVPDFAGQIEDVEFTLFSKLYPNNPAYHQTGPFTLSPNTDRVNFRLQARQVRMRFKTARAGGFWRMGANRIDLAKTAARR